MKKQQLIKTISEVELVYVKKHNTKPINFIAPKIWREPRVKRYQTDRFSCENSPAH